MKKSMKRSVDLRIETLRGFAIIGVVAHHVSLWMTGAIHKAAIDPNLINSILVFFSDFFTPLRMPLFTIISGWVYAIISVTKYNIRPYLTAKVRRIVIPLLVVSTCLYFLQGIMTDDFPGIAGKYPQDVPPHKFWIMWFYHFQYLWFLQAIMILFVIIAIIDYFQLMESVSQWLFWIFIAIVTYYIFPRHVEFFSLGKMKSIFPFFIFGVGLNRFQQQILDCKFLIFSGPVLLLLLLLNYLGVPGFLKPFTIYSLLIGAVTPIFFLSINFTFRPLVRIAKYSYAIYLYHGIVFLLFIPISSWLMRNNYQTLWALLYLVGGIGVPVILEIYAKNIPYIRTLLLGKKT